jgi:predicted Rdx family selenoprotein
MSGIVASVYQGIVNAHLHNGAQTYSPHYEFGYIYGGIYILGFCTWLHEYVHKNSIEKLLFVLRDGEIYSKAFNLLFDDVENECILWSRLASSRTNARWEQKRFLAQITSRFGESVGDSLILFNCEEMMPLLPEELSAEKILQPDDQERFRLFLLEHWGLILQEQADERRRASDYIRGYIAGKKNIALVDCGWVGRSASSLKSIIREQIGPSVEVKIAFAALSLNEKKRDGGFVNVQEMKNEFSAYLFSQEKNMAHYNRAQRRYINQLFELLTQSKTPSFIGFGCSDVGAGRLFDEPEEANHQMVDEIQRGVIDFVRQYHSIFSNYQYMYHISGQDAYRPFYALTENLDFFANNFEGIVMPEEAGKPKALKSTVRQRLGVIDGGA